VLTVSLTGRPGPGLSDLESNLLDQSCDVWHNHWRVPEASQAVHSPICPCFLLTETHFSIVSRMLSNLPSQIRQAIEFIRPMVEERFAKMEEYGEDWRDSTKPVCQTTVSGNFFITWLVHRTIC